MYKKTVEYFLSSGILCIRTAEPLANHSTWRIGGPADVLVEPASSEQVGVIITHANETGIPLLVIGRGSNLLFSDEGIRGIVMKIGMGLGGIEQAGDQLHVGAGELVSKIARYAMKQGLSGLEHIIGIPGSLGGLVAMNGGSLRHSIGESIITVDAVGSEGALHTISRDSCEFSYRHSRFQTEQSVITAVQLQCERGDMNSIRSLMLKILRDRRSKFPNKEPNCGSVFLSDPVMYQSIGPPGKIIEQVGLKGVSIGGARISTKHANFIVNNGNASSQDVLALIKNVQETVFQQTGYVLACEVRFVMPNGRVVPACY